MSTDRELLELAAKAAGIEIEPCTCSDPKWPFRTKGRIGTRGHWNPLANDGDALRLAMSLEMPIHPGRVWKSYRAGYDHDFTEASRNVSPLSDPPATRRAIVEVAAEIGRSMP